MFLCHLENGDELQVAVNEEHEPQALQDPILQRHLLGEIPSDKLSEGTKAEMDKLQEFGVKEDIQLDLLDPGVASVQGLVRPLAGHGYWR